MTEPQAPKPATKSTAPLVRSSAAEYLTFIAASGQGAVEAVYADESIWVTQIQLPAIIAVGYKVSSERAVQFRK